jgi:transcriptional regulator with XRE-family HTH domain
MAHKQTELKVMFAQRLKQSCYDRYGSGFKQKELAAAIGVSDAAVSQYFRDGVIPKLETAVHLADELGVCTEWLVSGRGPKVPAIEGGLKSMFERVRKLPRSDQLELLSILSDSLRDK